MPCYWVQILQGSTEVMDTQFFYLGIKQTKVCDVVIANYIGGLSRCYKGLLFKIFRKLWV